MHLEDARAAKEALAFAPDPKYRTALTHTFMAWHGPLNALARWLSDEDIAFRSGVCTALGFLDENDLTPADKTALVNALLNLYRDAPDGSTHSAAGWTLRRWSVPLPSIEPAATAPSGRQWFVNRLGMTMIRIPAGKFIMGDAETAHEVELTRGYFAADREVTVAQYRQFAEEATAAGEKAGMSRNEISPTDDCPAQQMSWFDAVRFCNWLSQREGRAACYTLRPGELRPGERIETWEANWDANGYRLLTEAEWEYACRAGTITRYAFGDDPELLAFYGFSAANSKGRAWPGGLKAPECLGTVRHAR